MPAADIFQARRAALQRKLAICKANIAKALAQLENLMRELNPDQLQARIQKQVNESGIMGKIMQNRFDAQATHVPSGIPWVPDQLKTLQKKGYKKTLVGSGKLRREAIKVVMHTFWLTGPIKWEDLVQEIDLPYAEVQNEDRPFMEDPNEQELQPVYELADLYLEQELKRILS
jgi:hypothetical protein